MEREAEVEDESAKSRTSGVSLAAVGGAAAAAAVLADGGVDDDAVAAVSDDDDVAAVEEEEVVPVLSKRAVRTAMVSKNSYSMKWRSS